ncbi:MAG: (Dimethylallyl)adenosine tRNA methylthiotransferase MiaB [Syntrophorhabdus sp. PtaB.Bin047]|nr:MAG: (Dimethylallyl)adenosine tRNA methylthiotransferase MiaB [Syntrophorhabdus sp. PtaB.Bin047]
MRFVIENFGCQMNDHDMEKMGSVLIDHGHLPGSMDDADIVIVNTCCIREKAEQKFYSLMGRLQHLRRKKGTILGVTGCIAEQEKENIFERLPFIDFSLGPSNIHRIAEAVENATGQVRTSAFGDDGRSPSLLIRPHNTRKGVKGYVTIMKGCNNFCSYCVVPYVRGREESRKSGDVLAEVREMAERGIVDVTLLGQNVNSYNNGNDDLSFPELLSGIDAIPGISRLRFVTSHPKDISPELIACFGTLRTLCESIHLPFQSGSDRILALMNRGYTSSEYLGKVEALKDKCPGISLTADCIVGFPGEEDSDFEATMELMETVRFDGIFSFIYSARRSTAAAALTGRVPPSVAHERLSRLQKRQRAITLDSNRAMEGTRAEVLVEGVSKNSPDELTGRTRTGKIVNFRGDPGLVYKLVEVDIIKGYANSLRGALPDTPGR